MDHSVDIPPPPEPQQHVGPSFHADSVGGVPDAVHDVPPAPVTKGWLAGSSTARVSSVYPLPRQSSDPSSPEAATTLWPWAAASSKRVSSAWAEALPADGSHRPHDVEMTRAVSSA